MGEAKSKVRQHEDPEPASNVGAFAPAATDSLESSSSSAGVLGSGAGCDDAGGRGFSESSTTHSLGCSGRCGLTVTQVMMPGSGRMIPHCRSRPLRALVGEIDGGSVVGEDTTGDLEQEVLSPGHGVLDCASQAGFFDWRQSDMDESIPSEPSPCTLDCPRHAEFLLRADPSGLWDCEQGVGDEAEGVHGTCQAAAEAMPARVATFASPKGAGVSGRAGGLRLRCADQTDTPLPREVAGDRLEFLPLTMPPEGPPVSPVNASISPVFGLATPPSHIGHASSKEAVKRLGYRKGLLEETVIIFDWDDTLLCSSALGAVRPSQLLELGKLVEEVLLASMSLGVTMIVTNAHRLWVQDSAARFVPGLLPTLERLTIVSARERHEESCPGDYFAWKRKAFCELLTEQGAGRLLQNLVVLGDSLAEMQAAHHASNALSVSPLVKTVKFKESPSPTDLIGQLRAVGGNLVVKAAKVAVGTAKAALRNTAAAAFGGRMQAMPNPLDLMRNDDDEELEKEEEERRASVDPKYLEYEAAEFSACRMNCKLKAVLAAAASAGLMYGAAAGTKRAAGGNVGGMLGAAGPLDEWTICPVFLALGERRVGIDMPLRGAPRAEHKRFL